MNNKDELFPIMTENYIKDVDDEILQDLVELQEDPEGFKKKAAEIIALLDERSRSLFKKCWKDDHPITLEQAELLSKVVKPREANWLIALTDEELKILQLIRNAGTDGVTQSQFIDLLMPEDAKEDSPGTVFNRGVKFFEALKSAIYRLESKGFIRVEHTVTHPHPKRPITIFKCWIKED